jgi:manganese/zinc/iron transport system permease protein
MLTDRLGRMIAISVVLAIVSAVLGHVAAIEVPSWFGYRSTTTAGMMAVVAGMLLFLCALLGPRHGIATRFFRRRLLALKILADDIVALLYRMQERDGITSADPRTLQSTLLADSLSLRIAVRWLGRKQQVETRDGTVSLTAAGEAAARQLIRSHRLWEQYLSSHASMDSDRLHDKAEQFEHFTDRILRDELDAATGTPAADPHGTPIPSEQSDEL